MTKQVFHHPFQEVVMSGYSLIEKIIEDTALLLVSCTFGG